MRILHFIPDIGVSNGVMSVILNYAKAMPEDIVFDVVYFHETPETRQADIEALGGKVYKIDRPSPKDILVSKTKAFFNEHKNEWQALHIHAPHFSVFIAPEAKKAGINKICVHCHTTEYSLKGSSARNKLLSLYAKYFIKDKFACSNNAGKLWYGNKSFTVVNNAIDCKKYAFNEEKRAEVRSELGLNDKFVVCHIGRTDIPQKNHPFLFKIFAEVKKKKPDSVLMLIGAEPTDELNALADELGISDSVMYLGYRNDVCDLLQVADVFVFPSISEGLPVSVIEAQAASLPCIISDTITDEVIVTDLVKRISINEPPTQWAESINFITDLQRKQVSLPLWDIDICKQKLIDYYR